MNCLGCLCIFKYIGTPTSGMINHTKTPSIPAKAAKAINTKPTQKSVKRIKAPIPRDIMLKVKFSKNRLKLKPDDESTTINRFQGAKSEVIRRVSEK